MAQNKFEAEIDLMKCRIETSSATRKKNVRGLYWMWMALWISSIASIQASSEDQVDFIRVYQSPQYESLQTVTTSYRKGDVQVDCIGVIHIADRSYYQKLNESFISYDRLLFEMVGGEGMGQGVGLADAQAGATHQAEGLLALIPTLFGWMVSTLDLSGQMECIDYSAQNFRHADLTYQEFIDLQAERKESMWKLAFAEVGARQGNSINSLELLLAFLLGNSGKMKLALIDSLSQIDELMPKMKGVSVIIGERNKRCLEVMEAQINQGFKRIGIFYGAGHCPDFDQRLLSLGYERTGQKWMDAWKIPKTKKHTQIIK